MSRGEPIVVSLLRLRIKDMSSAEIEAFTEAFNEWCDEYDEPDEDDDEEDEGEDDEDDLRADDEDAEQPEPSKDRWPGNIRLRTPPPESPTQTAGHGRIVGLGDIAKLHAIGARVGYNSQDPNMQAVYAAAIARRKAFGDLAEELGKVRSPYTRDMILGIIDSLDDPPWETAIQDAPPGPETIAALAGQWKCVCGCRNNDLRRACRNCSGRRP